MAGDIEQPITPPSANAKAEARRVLAEAEAMEAKAAAAERAVQQAGAATASQRAEVAAAREVATDATARTESAGGRVAKALAERQRLLQEYVRLQQEADAIRAFRAGVEKEGLERLRQLAPAGYNVDAIVARQNKELRERIPDLTTNKNALTRAQAAADAAKKALSADVTAQKTLFPPPKAPPVVRSGVPPTGGVGATGYSSGGSGGALRLEDLKGTPATYKALDEIRASRRASLRLEPHIEKALLGRPAGKDLAAEVERQKELARRMTQDAHSAVVRAERDRIIGGGDITASRLQPKILKDVSHAIFDAARDPQWKSQFGLGDLAGEERAARREELDKEARRLRTLSQAVDSERTRRISEGGAFVKSIGGKPVHGSLGPYGPERPEAAQLREAEAKREEARRQEVRQQIDSERAGREVEYEAQKLTDARARLADLEREHEEARGAKLTTPQRGLLTDVAAEFEKYGERPFLLGGRQQRTAEALAKRGLLKTWDIGLTRHARITEQGRGVADPNLILGDLQRQRQYIAGLEDDATKRAQREQAEAARVSAPPPAPPPPPPPPVEQPSPRFAARQFKGGTSFLVYDTEAQSHYEHPDFTRPINRGGSRRGPRYFNERGVAEAHAELLNEGLDPTTKEYKAELRRRRSAATKAASAAREEAFDRAVAEGEARIRAEAPRDPEGPITQADVRDAKEMEAEHAAATELYQRQQQIRRLDAQVLGADAPMPGDQGLGRHGPYREDFERERALAENRRRVAAPKAPLHISQFVLGSASGSDISNPALTEGYSQELSRALSRLPGKGGKVHLGRESLLDLAEWTDAQALAEDEGGTVAGRTAMRKLGQKARALAESLQGAEREAVQAVEQGPARPSETQLRVMRNNKVRVQREADEAARAESARLAIEEARALPTSAHGQAQAAALARARAGQDVTVEDVQRANRFRNVSERALQAAGAEKEPAAQARLAAREAELAELQARYQRQKTAAREAENAQRSAALDARRAQAPRPRGTELIPHPTEFGRAGAEPDYWTGNLERIAAERIAARGVTGGDVGAIGVDPVAKARILVGQAKELDELRRFSAEVATPALAESGAAEKVERQRERAKTVREEAVAQEASGQAATRAGGKKANAAERAAAALERQNVALRDAGPAANEGEAVAAQIILAKRDAAIAAAEAVERQNEALRAAGGALPTSTRIPVAGPVGAPAPSSATRRTGSDILDSDLPPYTDEAAHYGAYAPGQQHVGRGFSTPEGVPLVPIPHNLDDEQISTRLQSRANSAYLAAYNRELTRQANDAVEAEDAVQRLARAEGEAARAQQVSAVSMDANSRSWSRYGALTTEFIDAARRGEASYRDWGSQIVQTGAKFAGWTLVSLPIFAALDGIRQLGRGAIDSASGVQQLRRTIDNVDPSRAQGQFRDLSHQFNVPIGEVADAVGRMGQVFHNQDDAAQAATAALYSFRTGGVSVEDSTKNLTAVVNGFGLSADDLIVVFDQLNQAQNRFGATIPDTEAGLAKVAGSFRNAGSDASHALALIVTAQRVTGRSGQEIGTALARSVGFVQRPSNLQTLAEFGLDPKRTSYQDLIEQAMGVAGNLQGQQLQRLATALSSPQYARIFVPLLQNAQRYQRILRDTSPEASKGSAQQELHRILAGVDEQIKSIGTGLERLGSNLAEAGLLNVFVVLLKTLNASVELTNRLLDAFNKLPEPLRKTASALAQIGALVAVARRFNIGARLEGTRFTGAGAFLSESPDRFQARQLRRALRAEDRLLRNELDVAGVGQGRASLNRTAAVDTLRQVQRGAAADLASGDPQRIANANARIAAAGRAELAAQEAFAAAEVRFAALSRQMALIEERNAAILGRMTRRGGGLTAAQATEGTGIRVTPVAGQAAIPAEPLPVPLVGVAPRTSAGYSGPGGARWRLGGSSTRDITAAAEETAALAEDVAQTHATIGEAQQRQAAAVQNLRQRISARRAGRGVGGWLVGGARELREQLRFSPRLNEPLAPRPGLDPYVGPIDAARAQGERALRFQYRMATGLREPKPPPTDIPRGRPLDVLRWMDAQERAATEIEEGFNTSARRTANWIRNTDGQQSRIRAAATNLATRAGELGRGIAAMFGPVEIGLVGGLLIQEGINRAKEALARNTADLEQASITPTTRAERDAADAARERLRGRGNTFGEREVDAAGFLKSHAELNLIPVAGTTLYLGGALAAGLGFGGGTADKRQKDAQAAADFAARTAQRRAREITDLSRSGDTVILEPVAEDIREATSNAVKRLEANTNKAAGIAELNRDIEFILKSIDQSNLDAKVKSQLRDAAIDTQVGKGVPIGKLMERLQAETPDAMDKAIDTLGQLVTIGAASNRDIRQYVQRITTRTRQLAHKGDPASKLRLAQLQQAPFEAFKAAAQAGLEQDLLLAQTSAHPGRARNKALDDMVARSTEGVNSAKAVSELRQSDAARIVALEKKRQAAIGEYQKLDRQKGGSLGERLARGVRKGVLIDQIASLSKQEEDIGKEINDLGKGVNSEAAKAAEVAAKQERYRQRQPLIEARRAAHALLVPAGLDRMQYELAGLQADYQRAVEAFGADSVEALNALQHVREAQAQIIQEQVDNLSAKLDAQTAALPEEDQPGARNRAIENQIALMRRLDPKGLVYKPADYDRLRAQMVDNAKQNDQNLIDAIHVKYDLLRSVVDPANTSKIAQYDAREAAEVLARGRFHSRRERKTAEAQRNRTRIGAAQAENNQQLEHFDFLVSIGVWTSDQLRARLQKFLRDHKNLKDTDRRSWERAKQALHQLDQDDTEFGLNPANIKLPTVTELRRTISGGSRGITQNNSPTFNINIHGPHDIDRLGRVFERQAKGAQKALARATRRR